VTIDQGDARKDQVVITKNKAGKCSMKVVKPGGTQRSIDSMAEGASSAYDSPFDYDADGNMLDADGNIAHTHASTATVAPGAWEEVAAPKGGCPAWKGPSG